MSSKKGALRYFATSKRPITGSLLPLSRVKKALSICNIPVNIKSRLKGRLEELVGAVKEAVEAGLLWRRSLALDGDPSVATQGRER
jgi:hypothetical protein